MALTELYANTCDTDFTINFFMKQRKPRRAYLAAPFFSENSPDPIDNLTSKGCDVRLIVRFSAATTPNALKNALNNPKVKVRYFTGTNFHTKLYIVDGVALVGSANLTSSGLQSNRELSILLRQERDETFNSVCAVFEDLWNDADVLNQSVLDRYTKAFKNIKQLSGERAFENAIHDYIEPVKPSSVVVGSSQKSPERVFVQRFRRKYDEILGPAYKEFVEVAKASGIGRPEFSGQDHRIEMDRFLCWLAFDPSGGVCAQEAIPLKDRNERAARISQCVQDWQSCHSTENSGMYPTAAVIASITNIQTYLCDSEELKKLSYDDLFYCLTGCNAFYELERFAPKDVGEELKPLERLRRWFQQCNSYQDVVRTVDFLLSGPGDSIERAYDCVYGDYRLKYFAEACVMELLGWCDPERPPYNGRSIRGIELLGFDLSDLTAGS